MPDRSESDDSNIKAEVADARTDHGDVYPTNEPRNEENDDNIEYPSLFRRAIIMLTLNLTTFIASLDLGIVATAIPAITADFGSLDQIAWYSGACFIFVASSSAMWGKLFTYLPARWVYFACLALYLIGSIVAAAAPNSIALIVGRAIQGWGCSGTLSGSLILINFTMPPQSRPMLIGIWMGVFMGSTVLGPVLGGVFTTEVTWRWCFWVNLPIGGLALGLQLLFLRVPRQIKPKPATWKEILLQLDPLGFVIFATSLICYTLALEWGGLSKSWSSGSVIATLVMWVVLMVAFVGNEWFMGVRAMTPLYLLKSRLTWSSCLYAFISNCANFQVLFYLPIYFQSVQGDSAILSGVYLLPYVVFYAVGSLTSGAIISKTRHIFPLEVISPLIAIIGTGLLYAMDINTPKAWFIGAQIPFGFGIGLGTMAPVTSLQAFSDPAEVAVITGTLFTFQTASGAIFNTAAQSLFENRLHQDLLTNAPGLDLTSVDAAGAGGIREAFSGADLTAVLNAYEVGVKDVFAFAIAGACAAVLCALLIPMKRLPAPQESIPDEKRAAVEDDV